MNDSTFDRKKCFFAAILLAAVFCLLQSAPLAAAEPADGVKATWNEAAIAAIAPVPDTATLTFFFCSDLHIPFDDKGVVAKIAAAANKMLPSFVMTGGDNVQVGNPPNFSSLRTNIRKFKVPYIAAIGNHDTAFDDYGNQAEWIKRFGKTFFYFDAGPARFIFINNANYEPGEEQFVFLENALKTNLRKFVIMHRPINYLLPEFYTTPMAQSERFKSLVEAGKVTAVFMGHEHHSGIYDIGGVKYIVAGGAGGKLDPAVPNSFHHFIIGRVSPAGFEFDIEKL